MRRTVTLVVVDAAGDVLGVLPSFGVSTPWWQDVSEFGRGVQVLRLLSADRPEPPGGAVTYLAEVTEGSVTEGLATRKLATANLDLRPHPRRAPYAEPGGPAATIGWALAALGRPGLVARQQRTWNLSAVWRLDDAGGSPVAWLKQVPSFFAHEAAAIGLVNAVAAGLAPAVLAAGDPGRLLMAHLPGADNWDAGPDVCEQVAAAFHPVQAHYADHPVHVHNADNPAATIPVDDIDFAKVAEPYLGAIPGLPALIDGLPRRLAGIAACGVPDTLIHGDLHLGNVLYDEHGRPTIIDWGDSAIGHPAVDLLRITGRIADPEPLYESWARRWQASVPGCDPHRALDLMRPVAALREAAVMAHFVDSIEPTEWPYHAADVPDRLARAASMVG